MGRSARTLGERAGSGEISFTLTVVVTPAPLPEAVWALATVSRVAGSLSRVIRRRAGSAGFGCESGLPRLGARFCFGRLGGGWGRRPRRRSSLLAALRPCTG